MSAPPTPPPASAFPPGYAEADRGHAAIVIFWVECAFAICVIAARFTARRLNRSIGVDDWFMLLTVLLFTAASCVLTSVAGLGGFKHLPFVPIQNGPSVGLQNMVLQSMIVFAFGASKFSVGYFILRILPPSSFWRKWFIWGLIVVVLALNWSEVIAQWNQCHPQETLWNPTMPGTCWSSTTVLTNFYAGSIFNIVVDVILSLLPISVVWNLNTSIHRRICLSVLLGMGLFAAACSCVKVSYGYEIVSNDPTWGGYDLTVWSGSEVFVIIVCGSMPPLATLWDRFVMKKLPSRASKYDSNANSDDSSKGSSSKGGEVKKGYGHRVTASSSTATTSSINSEDDDVDVEKLSDDAILARTDVEITTEEKRLSPNDPIPGI